MWKPKEEKKYYVRAKTPMSNGHKDPLIYPVQAKGDGRFSVLEPDHAFATGETDISNKLCRRDYFNHIEFVTEKDYLSQFTFSKSFLDLMSSMKYESRIAKLICNYSNFMSCNSSHADILILDRVFTGGEISFLTMRGAEFSYLPKGKPHLTNDDGTWKREGRQTGKPSKAIRKVLTKNALKLFKESDFEAFNNLFKAKTNGSSLKIDILPA